MKRIPDKSGEFHIPRVPTGVWIGGAALALFLIVASSLFYTVAPDEQGIILTFGRYSGTASPGFHFKWPWPIQTVECPQVAEVKRVEIGFRSATSGENLNYQTFLNSPELRQEAQMLTGDENVVDCSMAVQYRIKDPPAYLFNFREGEAEMALRAVAESAVRQAVGDHRIDDVLTTGKVEVQTEVQAKMQELADMYGLGVTVLAVQLQDVQPPNEVAPAFRDVATAREERERMINEAEAYEREQIPRAEGEVARIKQEAEAYRQTHVAEAKGQVARFLAISRQYEASPEVTRLRLYLDAMSALFAKTRLTVIDENTGLENLRLLQGGATPGPRQTKTPAAPSAAGDSQ
ncbi:MAG: FtsH protease activity modulator HflK [Candidatus Hydrogenedentes bacterium]|nr:FtsH protease activity modulator HflK [Candidatus Hydrogenedentota bacterium]